MGSKMQWNTKQIADSLKNYVFEQDGFDLGAISLIKFESNSKIGIGKNRAGKLILVLPGQNDVTAFTTKYATFDPWTNFIEVNGGRTIEGAAILKCSIDTNDADSIEAVAAIFFGIIDLQIRFGSCGKAIWQMRSLFENGFSYSPSENILTGLVGEICCILASENYENFVSAWHGNIDDKYDFSFQNIRIETKSTLKNKRQHHYSSHQIPGILPEKTYVASVLVQKTEIGTSFSELAELLFEKLADDTAEKALMIILNTIKVPINFIEKFNIDLTGTLSSIKLVGAESIPTPQSVEGVLDFNWEAIIPESCSDKSLAMINKIISDSEN